MTKKFKDFSLHFSTKDQDFEVLKQKYYDFDADTLESNEVLNTSSDAEELVLHHCFLPEKLCVEKSIPLDAVEFLETVCESQVNWYHVTDKVEMSRYVMLRNLKRLGGVAIFLGEIKGGVKEEYELARHLEIPCVLLEV